MGLIKAPSILSILHISENSIDINYASKGGFYVNTGVNLAWKKGSKLECLNDEFIKEIGFSRKSRIMKYKTNPGLIKLQTSSLTWGHL